MASNLIENLPVHVRVPASTANLGPGFDTLGLALELHNELILSPSPSGKLEIEIFGDADFTTVARDEHNLVYRAMKRIYSLANTDVPPLRLELTIRAPLARGMGSSASAITAGMAAANASLQTPLDDAVLLQEMVAMEGHPDNVVACAKGGLVACVRSGSKLMYTRTLPHPSLRFVLLIPDYELATMKAREAIPKSVPFRDAVFNLSRVPLVLDRLATGQIEDLSLLMDDRLHQPYRKSLVRQYDIVVGEAEKAGAAAVVLSGAGPTMLAVATSQTAPAVELAMRGVLESVGVKCATLIMTGDAEGIRFLD